MTSQDPGVPLAHNMSAPPKTTISWHGLGATSAGWTPLSRPFREVVSGVALPKRKLRHIGLEFAFSIVDADALLHRRRFTWVIPPSVYRGAAHAHDVTGLLLWH